MQRAPRVRRAGRARRARHEKATYGLAGRTSEPMPSIVIVVPAGIFESGKMGASGCCARISVKARFAAVGGRYSLPRNSKIVVLPLGCAGTHTSSMSTSRTTW